MPAAPWSTQVTDIVNWAHSDYGPRWVIKISETQRDHVNSQRPRPSKWRNQNSVHNSLIPKPMHIPWHAARYCFKYSRDNLRLCDGEFYVILTGHRSSDICLNVILGVGAEVSGWDKHLIGRRSKADCPPSCAWTSSNPMKARIEQKGWEFSLCLSGSWDISPFITWANSYIFSQRNKTKKYIGWGIYIYNFGFISLGNLD